jgi:hypothetical protein
MAIDVRKAVISARDYLNSVQDLLGRNLENIRLEEVELTENEEFWFVTLSFASFVGPESKKPLYDVISPSPQLERTL